MVELLVLSYSRNRRAWLLRIGGKFCSDNWRTYEHPTKVSEVDFSSFLNDSSKSSS